MPDLASRFWDKVVVGMECWGWAASKNAKGYGYIGLGNGRVGTAHRVSYALHYGPIPAGAHVLHTCDNPQCCNPAHLVLGTNADNVADRQAKGRYRGCGDCNKGRRNPAAVSERTRYRRARFAREGGRIPYVKC